MQAKLERVEAAGQEMLARMAGVQRVMFEHMQQLGQIGLAVFSEQGKAQMDLLEGLRAGGLAKAGEQVSAMATEAGARALDTGKQLTDISVHTFERLGNVLTGKEEAKGRKGR